jgi:hypothetical protein
MRNPLPCFEYTTRLSNFNPKNKRSGSIPLLLLWTNIVGRGKSVMADMGMRPRIAVGNPFDGPGGWTGKDK